MTPQQYSIATIIYDGIKRQAFNKWYNEGNFDNHLQDNEPSKDQILEDIGRLFGFQKCNYEHSGVYCNKCGWVNPKAKVEA